MGRLGWRTAGALVLWAAMAVPVAANAPAQVPLKTTGAKVQPPQAATKPADKTSAKAVPAKTKQGKIVPAKSTAAKSTSAKSASGKSPAQSAATASGVPAAKATAASKPSTPSAQARPAVAAAKPAAAKATATPTASAKRVAPVVAAAAVDPVVTASLGSAKPATAPALQTEAPEMPFDAFVESLWHQARARGVQRTTFDAAFAGVVPDPKVAELTRRQSEFVKPVWDYLDSAVTQARIEKGREMAAEWQSALAAAERRYGVERSVILGIWGMETNYGTFTGGKDVIRSLATLAHIGYRGDFFRDELLTALVILQQGHIDREDMKGSWAGAMGQTQFMPSSFMTYAVDADGDGHKNIWTSMPDAIASTANYLHKHGWTPGLPWAVEVRRPEGFDWKTRTASFPAWSRLGFRRADGKPMPHGGEASLFLPAGASGPIFLVTSNFAVIKRYNSSDAYALGVGHLGDRVMGGTQLAGDWPVGERPLDRDQRFELQRHLLRMGYDVGDPDGRFGTKTRDAVRDFQERRGLVPDGYANHTVLQALRETR
ncbi:lytic murein transglycosylase [uncultured Alsobacter sp.]|uniref:lytic murein transglycosylase n=1 Tax=uncultured Alsobacter sp. TaxID=1748258 RepID=UPI0025F28FC8|nr:lytic murein transglycosylase [uncultured Alsobacter sp.]